MLGTPLYRLLRLTSQTGCGSRPGRLQAVSTLAFFNFLMVYPVYISTLRAEYNRDTVVFLISAIFLIFHVTVTFREQTTAFVCLCCFLHQWVGDLFFYLNTYTIHTLRMVQN